jgi:hypothetical protein
VRKGYEPEVAILNEMLQKNHIAKGVKITSCAETDVPVAAEIFELSIRGLA